MKHCQYIIINQEKAQVDIKKRIDMDSFLNGFSLIFDFEFHQ